MDSSSYIKSKNFMHSLFLEYCRPWKLFTFSIGLILLIVGSYYYNAPDWDISISLIMATLSYLTAPLSLRILIERNWRLFPFMLLATWFTVDGSYWLYWNYKNPMALKAMREANFFASLDLYGMCGVLWLYHGSMKEFIQELRRIIKLRL